MEGAGGPWRAVEPALSESALIRRREVRACAVLCWRHRALWQSEAVGVIEFCTSAAAHYGGAGFRLSTLVVPQACDAAAAGDACIAQKVADSGAFDTALLDVPRIHLGF